MVDRGLKPKFAKLLGICRTNLYRESTKQIEKDTANIAKLKSVHAKEPYYGVDRLSIMLGWNKKKTRRIRNLAGVKVKRRQRRTRRTVKPEVAAPDNLLHPYYDLVDRSHPEKGYTFKALENSKLGIWVQDFTYIWWRGRFYYLACIKELSTRRIVGWCLSLHHNADMVCAALEAALAQYPIPKIVHNDRGSEYLSLKHANLCKKHHIAMSASAVGKPPENGFMESVFSGFKEEMSDVIKTCTSEAELYECIAAWLYYYNHIRIHTALKMSPAAYADILHNKSKPQLILSTTLPK